MQGGKRSGFVRIGAAGRTLIGVVGWVGWARDGPIRLARVGVSINPVLVRQRPSASEVRNAIRDSIQLPINI